MLWYGYIYYILFNTILISSVVFLLRLYFLNSVNQLSIIATSSRLFLSSLLFLFFITFTSLHYLLDYYQDILMFSSTDSCMSVLSTYYNSKIIDVNAVSLNLIQVYYYPFIYVFLIVTVLSVVFCLSYNTDELFSFMFYCLVILAAGYVIFFTDSIILFFFSIRNVIDTLLFYFI